MNKNLIVGLVALVVLLAGGAFLVANSKTDDTAGSTQPTTQNNSQASESMSDDMQMPEQSSQANSGASDDSSQAAATDQVTIQNYAYSPATITVKVGTKVTWTNQDSVKHDVVMDDSSADGPSSELLAKGESYSYTFTKAGTYEYHCSPHPYMKAKVIVTE